MTKENNTYEITSQQVIYLKTLMIDYVRKTLGAAVVALSDQDHVLIPHKSILLTDDDALKLDDMEDHIREWYDEMGHPELVYVYRVRLVGDGSANGGIEDYWVYARG